MTDTATTTLEHPASAEAPQPAPHVIEGEVPDAIELPTKPDFIVRGKVAETISAAEKAPQPFEATAQPEPKTPNFDPLIAEARRGWLAMRDSTLLALFGAVPAYNEALSFPDPWEVYCKDRGAKSRFPETAVFELMIMVDEERDEITPTTRSRCGALIAYFAKNCAGMTAREAVARVKAEGGFVKVATAYRQANPQVALKVDGTERLRPGRKPGPGGTRQPKGATNAVASTSTARLSGWVASQSTCRNSRRKCDSKSPKRRRPLQSRQPSKVRSRPAMARQCPTRSLSSCASAAASCSGHGLTGRTFRRFSG